MDEVPLKLYKKQTQISSNFSVLEARPDSDVTSHTFYASSCARNCQKIMKSKNLTEWYYLYANFEKAAITWFQEWNIST